MAAEGAKLATAYFELIPSMQGAQAKIAALVPSLGVVGTKAGGLFSTQFTKSSAGLAQASLKQLQADVASASTGVAQSRLRELDATGKVRVATAQLTEAVTKYGDTSSKTIASQEKLSSAQRVLSSVQDTVRANATKLTSAQSALGKATDDAANSSSRSSGVFARVGASIGEGFSGGMSTAISVVGSGVTAIVGIAAAGATAIGVTIGAALVSGFTRLSAIQTAQAKLKALGNTAADVGTIMENANTAVVGTQYSLADAATVAASAVAAGITPGASLAKYLRLVANTAAITGGNLSDIGSQLNFVQTRGAAYNDTLQQLAQDGLPIYDLIAKKLGTTANDVADLATQGKISSAVFNDALSSGVGDAAVAVGQTVEGSFENMKTAFARFGATALGPVFPVFQTLFSDVSKGLDTLGGIIGPLAQELGPKFLAAVKPSFDKLGPLFDNFAKSLGDFVKSPDGQKFFHDMGKAIKEVADALVKAAPTMIEFLKVSLKFIAAVTLLATQAAPAWIHGAQQIGDFTNTITSNVTTAISKISDGTFFQTVGEKFGTGWQQIVTGFSNGWQQIVTGFSNGGSQISTFVSGMWTNITGAFANGWLQITAFVSQMWANITGAFSNGWTQITTFVSQMWANITGAFSNGASQIGSFVSGLVGTIGGFFAQMWQDAVNATSTGIGNVVSTVGGLGGKVLGAIGDVSRTLYSSGKSIIQGFIDGIGAMVGKVGDAVGGVIDFAKGFFPNSPAKRGPLSGSGWVALKNSGQAIADQFGSGLEAANLSPAASSLLGLGSSVPSFTGSTANATAGVGLPSQVTLVDSNGSILGIMDVKIGAQAQADTQAGRRGFRSS